MGPGPTFISKLRSLWCPMERRGPLRVVQAADHSDDRYVGPRPDLLHCNFRRFNSFATSVSFLVACLLDDGSCLLRLA